MKIKVILFSLLLSVIGGSAFAQVEQDDMYFNSKDRAKLREAKKTSELTMASARKKEKQEEDEMNNPKDTYSARNVNPEFTSRSQSKAAQEDEEDYFVTNYRYDNVNRYNDFNNNFNNWYGNSFYRNSYWSPSINSWNSPYYGYYDSFNSPWYDPYWSQNGWSSSFSFHYGSNWNYGWGGNYNYWNRPYCPGWNSYYSSNAYWNSYRYPSTIVVINNSESAGRGVAYGKRPTRGSSIAPDRGETRSRSTSVSGSGRPSEVSGGRSSSNNRAQSEYYNRSWKNTNSQPATMDSRSSTQNNRSSNWSNSNNSFNNSNSNSSYERSSAPARSNSSFEGSGTRSHSSGSSSSGSNGRTRGRD
jgi:hypothetical protein